MESHDSATPPPSGTDTAGGAAKVIVAKDRACPYCQQAFTSSSLGRHLDLYIKSKNPKPPDGVHDVDEIRRIRGNITRRQPRNSGMKRERSADGEGRGDSHDGSMSPEPVEVRSVPTRDAAVPQMIARSQPPAPSRVQLDRFTQPPPPASTPALQYRPASYEPPRDLQLRHGEIRELARYADRPVHEGSTYTAPAAAAAVHIPSDFRPKPGFNRPNWLTTGVINDLPGKRDATTGRIARIEEPSHTDQDSRQRSLEESETGSAALLALKEVLGSVWDASLQNSLTSTLKFDILSLDFPSLCLRLLPAPTTLFTTHPWPTQESWPIEAPGQIQAEALQMTIDSHIRRFQDQARSLGPSTVRSFAEHTPKYSDHDAARFRDHIHQAYGAWMRLSEEQRRSTWQLETLRAFARAEEGKREAESTIEALQKQIEQMNMEISKVKNAWRGYPNVESKSGAMDLAGLTGLRLDKETLKQLSKQGLDLSNWDLDKLVEKWRAVVREDRKALRELPLPSASTLHGLQSTRTGNLPPVQSHGSSSMPLHVSSASTSNSDPSRAASSTTSPYSTTTANRRVVRRTTSFDSPATNGSVNGAPADRDDEDEDEPPAGDRAKARRPDIPQINTMQRDVAHNRVPSMHIPRYWTPTEITGQWPPARNRERDDRMLREMEREREQIREQQRLKEIERQREEERRRKKREAETREEEERARRMQYAQRSAAEAGVGAERPEDRSNGTTEAQQRRPTSSRQATGTPTMATERPEAGEFWRREIDMAASGSMPNER